jgi:phenylacetate-CoA ligase
MAGLAYFLGVRKMGAGIIRIGPGSLHMQWQSILDLKPTALIIVPSFLTNMIDFADEHHIDYKNSSVSKAVCIGESIRNQDFSLNTLGRRIKERWDIDLFSTYASTEMATAFTECPAGQGGHHQPDLIVTEIVDEDGNCVQDGNAGELVITTLGIEGYPLIRFKTGDICVKHTGQCSCRRHTYRLGPVLGRKKQMIKYKGTTLYPTAIYDILDGLQWIDAYQIQLKTDNHGCDDIVLNINEITDDQLSHLKLELEAKLRVKPGIKLWNIADLHKIIFLDGYRKPIKFSDLRTPKN